MVNAVRPHLDEHEKIPVFFCNPLFDQFKALFGHAIDLAQQVILILGAEVRNIYEIIAHGGPNLLHRGSRIGIRPLGVVSRWGKTTTYLNTVDWLGRVGWWQTHGNDFFSCSC